MNFITQIARWIVGLLFIFSGLVKTIDPIGFSIKLEEYFSPSVFNLPFLQSIALPLSVFFVIFEVVLGVLLILGIWKRFTLISLLGLIVFFTFLTFYSAYFNKVTDCGCFGDAIKLTPWESFGKDVFLLILILILWAGQKYIKPLLAKPIGDYITIASLIGAAFIAYQGIYHLPIKDFRPYAIGKNIKEGMKTGEELGKEPPVISVEYKLKNKLNGQEVTLSENDYVNQDMYWKSGSPWEILDTQNKVIKEGYEPPIHDFEIECGDSGDLTYYYLDQPRVIMVVTSVPFKANDEALNKVSEFVNSLDNQKYTFVSVASDEVVISNLKTCLMDATTLKTMIRSNPGVIFLKQGTVVGKFNWHDLPESDDVASYFN